MPPWFENNAFPLYLAPMAGVTDRAFRTLCKELGADVMVTEFVSSEGIVRRNERTRRYVDFDEAQRPVGVQLFGADPQAMADGARSVVDWVAPDFIDLNFGCPVNKVVAKNGGSSLLRQCPILEAVAKAVVNAVAPLPVTAKIRIGWDDENINAVDVSRILEGCGIQAIAVHGRTRQQGYSGEADWQVIGEVASAVRVPVIGNGDIATPADVARRKRETGVSAVMIGRAAMADPWLFRRTKAFLADGTVMEEPTLEERWALILRHCRMAVDLCVRGGETTTMHAMRARLMAYTKGMPDSRRLRQAMSQVGSLADIEQVAEDALRAAQVALEFQA
jgi:nifR3 family TIM-barrel protein